MREFFNSLRRKALSPPLNMLALLLLRDSPSLGAIVYEMTTGETPFGGDSPYVIMNARVTGDPQAPRKLNPKLTPVMEEIILHAMERDPKRRYQTAVAMRTELENYEVVDITHRHSRLQAPQVWKSRFRMLPMILILVFAWILSFVLLFLYLKAHSGKGHSSMLHETVADARLRHE